MVDLLAATKLNDEDETIEENPQLNHGNKISKKNKKKNKNQQDLEDELASIVFSFYLSNS